MLNGNIGVIKCMMTGKYFSDGPVPYLSLSMDSELTDSTNMAQGFAMMPVMWSIGGTVGYDSLLISQTCADKFQLNLFRPLIGGVLAKPHDQWPGLFSNNFWIKYPYFLPCAASAAFSAFVFFLTLFFLKEVCPPSSALEVRLIDVLFRP